MTGRPVDGGGVAVEQRVPIDGLALGGGAPPGRLRGVGDDLEHVMARPERQLLERELGRKRAGAHEAGADHGQRHVKTPQARGDVLLRSYGTILYGREAGADAAS
jgi:hypothetical protein